MKPSAVRKFRRGDSPPIGPSLGCGSRSKRRASPKWRWAGRRLDRDRRRAWPSRLERNLRAYPGRRSQRHRGAGADRRVEHRALKRALDLGADGVVVPWIESAEQLRQAVSFAQFPPGGVRGIGAERATCWGQCFVEHRGEANEHVLVVPIIESVQGGRKISSMLCKSKAPNCSLSGRPIILRAPVSRPVGRAGRGGGIAGDQGRGAGGGQTLRRDRHRQRKLLEFG